MKPKKDAPAKELPPLAKLSDEELTKELDFYFEKVMNADSDIFSEYQETAKTFVEFATEAIRRGERILNEKGKEKARRLISICKDGLRQFYEVRRKARTDSDNV